MAPTMETIPYLENYGDSKNDVTDNSTNQLTNGYNTKISRTMDCQFHREDERLRTFHHWPIAWLDSHKLAATGMFYKGEIDMLDKVKCYFCEVEIGHWEEQDEPVSEHLKWSPNCPLLTRRTTNNVPIDPDYFESLLPPISYDICGANEPIHASSMRPQIYMDSYLPSSGNLTNMTSCGAASAAAASRSTSTVASQIQTEDVVVSLPQPISNPSVYYHEYPEYAVEQARFRSFANWPKNMKQKPEQLAEAGFFYTGTGDRVKCFSCGGGLKDWDVDDEPWEQHALWLGKCRYLKLIKGQSFIDSTIEKLTKAQEGGATDEATNSQPQPNQDQDQQATTTTNTTTIKKMVAPLLCKMSAASAIPTSVAFLPHAIAAESSSSNDVVNNENAPSTSSQTTISNDNMAARIHEKALLSNENTTNAITFNQENPEKKSLMAAVGIPEEKLCKICYAAEYNTAFLPCGHVVACAKCASSVTKCPLCRKCFTDVMRVYFS